MYNIDFKVSQKIVSIAVCINDTIPTLINKMNQLNAFRKYTCCQLQQKLIKSLTQIIKSQSIQEKIKIRIEQLLNKFQSLSKQKNSVVKNDINNNTIVNILQQQSTINTSYISKGISSQNRLRRKYNLQDGVQNENQNIEQRLNYNYKTGVGQNIYQSIQNSHKHNNHNYKNQKKKSFSYFYQSQQSYNTKSSHLININKNNNSDYIKQNNNYNNSKKTLLNDIQMPYSQSIYKQQNKILQPSYFNQKINKSTQSNQYPTQSNQYSTQSNPYSTQLNQYSTQLNQYSTQSNQYPIYINYSHQSPHKYKYQTNLYHDNQQQNQIKYTRQQHITNINQNNSKYNKKQNYNPVPKLNYLIQKSRSLSQIVQKNCVNHLKQRNTNIEHNLSTKKSIIGKIHHRQDINTIHQKIQTQLKIRQTNHIPKQTQQINLKVNYESIDNSKYKYSHKQNIKEIHKNYIQKNLIQKNSVKQNSVSQNLIRQNLVRQNSQNKIQYNKKYKLNKPIYSYL